MIETSARESEPQQPPAAMEKAADPQPAKLAARFDTIYFDLDRWSLGPDSRAALEENAAKLRAHPEWDRVTVEGHCDPRGSEEYNLALGSRRAAAVKRYLVDLGVPASRVETVTFGESRPAMRGEGEDVWRMNRRSEIRVETRQASR